VTTVLILVAVGFSTCFSSTFYTNYYAISIRVAWVNASEKKILWQAFCHQCPKWGQNPWFKHPNLFPRKSPRAFYMPSCILILNKVLIRHRLTLHLRFLQSWTVLWFLHEDSRQRNCGESFVGCIIYMFLGTLMHVIKGKILSLHVIRITKLSLNIIQ